MAGGDGTPQTSPWTYGASDYQGNRITITVPFNQTTLALGNATVFRDAACLYTHIYLGVGADGTPNSTLHTFTVPAGTTTITAGQLAANGLNTITDVTALQVTAGP